MKYLILIISLFVLSCTKEQEPSPSIEGGDGKLNVLISLNSTQLEETTDMSGKTASIKKIERLCKCTMLKALIYRDGNFIAEKDFEAGYVGTIFSGLTSNRTYRIIFYSVGDATSQIPTVTNRSSLSNATVELQSNSNLLHTAQNIYLNPGSNTISISLKHLYSESKFIVNASNLNNISNVKFTVLDNYKTSKVKISDGSFTGQTSNTYEIPVENVNGKVYTFKSFHPNIATDNVRIRVSATVSNQTKNFNSTYPLKKGYKYVKEIKFE